MATSYPQFNGHANMQHSQFALMKAQEWSAKSARGRPKLEAIAWRSSRQIRRDRRDEAALRLLAETGLRAGGTSRPQRAQSQRRPCRGG